MNLLLPSSFTVQSFNALYIPLQKHMLHILNLFHWFVSSLKFQQYFTFKHTVEARFSFLIRLNNKSNAGFTFFNDITLNYNKIDFTKSGNCLLKGTNHLLGVRFPFFPDFQLPGKQKSIKIFRGI